MMATEYRAILEKIEQGNFEKASVMLRGMRRSDLPQERMIRGLLSTRISLKNGNMAAGIPAVLDLSNAPPELAAEYSFVRGLAFFHASQFKEGGQSFLLAQEFYEKIGNDEKALLCSFNAFIGSTNSKEKALSDFEEMSRLRELQKTAQDRGSKRILGLVHRQKSYLYLRTDRPLAALEEARRAVEHLESHGPKSDLDLALIAAADAALDIGEALSADMFLQQVFEPIESRVELGWTYICQRSGRLPGPWTDSAFSYQCTFFSERARKKLGSDQQNVMVKIDGSIQKPRWIYNLEDGTICHPQKKTKVAHVWPRGLESKLLLQLSKAPHRKETIQENLWPEHSKAEHLDNRLHKLVSRVNQRIPGAVEFDGERYFSRVVLNF